MKTTLNTIVILTSLLVAAVSPCLALMSIENVSKKRAKELGIELRVKAGGPEAAWIELEFEPVGQLKDFQHVSLEIRDGKKFLLGWTPLKARRLNSGRVVVSALANRAFLEHVTLRVVTGDFRDSGHDLRVKDFVDLKNIP